MTRYNPFVLGLGGVTLILMIAVLVLAGDHLKMKTLARDAPLARARQVDDRCGSQATYDRIKLELFRQAAEIRSSDGPAFDRLAAYSSVRVERPLLRGHDPELGTIRCSGNLSIDLPPGVSVVGGRHVLNADIDYVLQPAADSSGDVVMLEGIDPITIPLATLARAKGSGTLPPLSPPPPPAPQPTASATASAPVAPAPPPVRQSPQVTEAVRQAPQAAQPVRQAPRIARAPVAPAKGPSGKARPSFNCRYARTGGEHAVCTEPGLAALDRQMSHQFYRALSEADASKRRRLTTSRDSFLRARDRCSTNACIASAYQRRIAEISAIMGSGD